MVFCEKCFCDTEIISVIRSKSRIGDCPKCGNKNVHLYVYYLMIFWAYTHPFLCCPMIIQKQKPGC